MQNFQKHSPVLVLGQRPDGTAALEQLEQLGILGLAAVADVDIVGSTQPDRILDVGPDLRCQGHAAHHWRIGDSLVRGRLVPAGLGRVAHHQLGHTANRGLIITLLGRNELLLLYDFRSGGAISTGVV